MSKSIQGNLRRCGLRLEREVEKLVGEQIAVLILSGASSQNFAACDSLVFRKLKRDRRVISQGEPLSPGVPQPP